MLLCGSMHKNNLPGVLVFWNFKSISFSRSKFIIVANRKMKNCQCLGNGYRKDSSCCSGRYLFQEINPPVPFWIWQLFEYGLLLFLMTWKFWFYEFFARYTHVPPIDGRAFSSLLSLNTERKNGHRSSDFSRNKYHSDFYLFKCCVLLPVIKNSITLLQNKRRKYVCTGTLLYLCKMADMPTYGSSKLLQHWKSISINSRRPAQSFLDWYTSLWHLN